MSDLQTPSFSGVAFWKLTQRIIALLEVLSSNLFFVFCFSRWRPRCGKYHCDFHYAEWSETFWLQCQGHGHFKAIIQKISPFSSKSEVREPTSSDWRWKVTDQHSQTSMVWMEEEGHNCKLHLQVCAKVQTIDLGSHQVRRPSVH